MRVNDPRGFDFGLGETADMLRDSVRGFAADQIAPRADEIAAEVAAALKVMLSVLPSTNTPIKMRPTEGGMVCSSRSPSAPRSITAAMGRVKKIAKSPADMVRDWRKLSSSMGARTRPRTIGAISKSNFRNT